MQTARVVAITGATGGIGSALVQRFLAHGDVADESSCSSAAEQIKEQHRRLNVLVNCAGYYPCGRLKR